MNKKDFSDDKLAAMSPKEFRSIVRRGETAVSTLVACRGYAQANLVVVPEEMAYEFLMFCQRNPRPCPVLDITEPGGPHPKLMAPEADLRTDLSGYRVFREGQLIGEPADITSYWRDDLVAFLLGCSLSFDWVLRAAGISFRLLGAYTTNIQCVPVGRFHGPMVVSCRLIKGASAAIRTIQISSRYPAFHGPPVHIGAPAIIGIKDFYHPEHFHGHIAAQEPDEVALYWGCGATPQEVAMEAKISFMITHGVGGRTFITDRLTEEMAAL